MEILTFLTILQFTFSHNVELTSVILKNAIYNYWIEVRRTTVKRLFLVFFCSLPLQENGRGEFTSTYLYAIFLDTIVTSTIISFKYGNEFYEIIHIQKISMR